MVALRLLLWLLFGTQAGASLGWVSFTERGFVNETGGTVPVAEVNLQNWLSAGRGLSPSARDDGTEATALQLQCETHLKSWRDQWVTGRHFGLMKEAGFTMVRIPIRHSVLLPQGDTEVREDAWGYLDWAIAQATEHRLYAVLDLLTIGHKACALADEADHSLATEHTLLFLWEQIAKRYAHNSTIAAYGLLLDHEAIRYEPSLAPRVVSLVRRHDPRHVLILPTLATAALSSVPNSANIVLSSSLSSPASLASLSSLSSASSPASRSVTPLLLRKALDNTTDDDDTIEPWLGAMLMGTAAAASYPIGALLGMFANISDRLLCFFMAFGSGALIFVLSIELFGDQLKELSEMDSRRVADWGRGMLLLFALLGSILFYWLNGLFAGLFDVEDDHKPRPRIKKADGTWAQQLKDEEAHGTVEENPPAHGYGGVDSVDFEDRRHQELGGSSFSKSIRSIAAAITPKHSTNAALAMWLGVLIDGVPEAMVLGFLANEGIYSVALVFGIFVANFPEAVSSAAILRQAGRSYVFIFGLWFVLVIITALAAMSTTFIFPADSPSDGLAKTLASCAAQGLAGGAMLAMVSSTMLPEAFEKGGGPLVSLSTVWGFVLAMAVKAFFQDETGAHPCE